MARRRSRSRVSSFWLGQGNRDRAWQAQVSSPVSPALLARPLADVLADAAECDVLRARLATITDELSEFKVAQAHLVKERDDQRRMREKAEEALIRRQCSDTVAWSPMSASLPYFLPFFSVADLGNLFCSCLQNYKAAQNDKAWSDLCLRAVGAEVLSLCSNFRATFTAHTAARQRQQMEQQHEQLYMRLIDDHLDETEPMRRSALRVMQWTITAPRLQKARDTGESIVSPSFSVGGAFGCNVWLYPGSGRSSRCGFFFEMPRGTTAHARVFIGDRSAWAFQHVWEDSTARGSDDIGPRICPSTYTSKPLMVQVEFDIIFADGAYDMVVLTSRKGEVK